MRQSRKRKLSSADTACSPGHANSIAAQQDIQSFGRISKAQQSDTSSKKCKTAQSLTLELGTIAPPTAALKPLETSSPSMAAPVAKSKKRSRDEEACTPQNKRFRDAIPPTPSETPSRAAAKLFGKLNLATSAMAASSVVEPPYGTPPLTPTRSDDDQDERRSTLPNAVDDVLRLFSSFLTALSLYYAHHGAGSPLLVRTLLPLVAKAWKRRQVFEEDIRRMLGVLGPEKTPFTLVDKGDGRVCLEKSTGPHINQHELNELFTLRLHDLWGKWKISHRGQNYTAVSFLDQLPVATVVHDEEAMPSSKVSKGQERLDQLRSGAIQARADEAASKKPMVAPESRAAAAVSSRGSNLLDRIMAKQQMLSTQPNGPTQEDLDRRAALDRIEEIVLVLDLLAGGRPRVSFSAQTMVQHLQSSLRNPIAKDEVERCMSLMAGEVTPGFVSLINTGRIRGIVVTKAGRPCAAELVQRLRRAGA